MASKGGPQPTSIAGCFASNGRVTRRIYKGHCQFGEVLLSGFGNSEVTHKLSRSGNIVSFLERESRSGNFAVPYMAQSFTICIFQRLRLKLGIYPRGSRTSELRQIAWTFNLGSGSKVKPLKCTIEALHGHGVNRGLAFTQDMAPLVRP